MSRRAQENLIAVMMLAVFVMLFVAALQFGPRARLVPLPIAGLAIVLVAAQIVWQNLRPADALQVDALEFFTGREVEAPKEAVAVEKGRTFRRELTAVGFVLLLLLLYVTLSPIPAVFLFTAGYLVARRHYPVVTALLFAFAVAAALLVTFRFGLGVPLDKTLFGYRVDVLWFL